MIGQIQHHFMFNALHTISALVECEPELAQDAIRKLSDLLRTSLRHDTSRTHRLADEIDWIERFLAFEEIRFESGLNVVVDVPQHFMSVEVPVLVLQPIVENALKHGVIVGEKPSVTIRALQSGDARLLLSVIDAGPGHNSEDYSAGYGLRWVRGQLVALFGADVGLRLYRRSVGGTEARIELPLCKA